MRIKRFCQFLVVASLFYAHIPLVQADSVTLAWDASDSPADTYRVFQRTSEKPYDYTKWVYQGSGDTCVIEDLASNETYRFVIRAYSGQEESPDSNEVSYTSKSDGGDDQTPDAGDQTPDAGDQTPDAGDKTPDAGDKTPDAGGTDDTNSTTDSNPEIATEEVIIDNSDSKNTSEGKWRISKGKNPFGENSLYSKGTRATYTFESSLAGDFDVYLWWSEWPSRSKSVVVEIYDGDKLIDKVDVNQKERGGNWHLLGGFLFTKQARITVVSPGDKRSVCADAVKFTSVSNSADSSDVQTDQDSDQNIDQDSDQNPDKDPGQNPEPAADEVVIDNQDSNNTSEGKWYVSKGKNFFGDDSLYSRIADATYTFESSSKGNLDIYLWWSGWASRSGSVPVKIYDGDKLVETVMVDQQQNSGQWNLLEMENDDYQFSEAARITIVSEDSSSSTCVDAVKITEKSDSAADSGKSNPSAND